MNRLAAFIALAWLGLTIAASAQFFIGFNFIATSGSVSCPYQATASTDGCSSAPVANAYTIQHANFYTGYANQSGQSYTSSSGWTPTVNGTTSLTVGGTVTGYININDSLYCNGVTTGSYIVSQSSGTTGGTGAYVLSQAVSSCSTPTTVIRPNFNVAGVDYPVGVDLTSTAVPGFLCDPLNPTSPPTGSSTNCPGLPTGCSLSGNQINCGQSSYDNGVALLFNGWDLSLHGGYTIYITNNYTPGAVTLKNIYWKNGSNTPNDGYFARLYNGPQVTIDHVLIDGNGNSFAVAQAAGTGFFAWNSANAVTSTGSNTACGTTHPVCIRYSVFLNSNTRWFSETAASSIDMFNDYAEGLHRENAIFTAKIDNGSGSAGTILTVSAVSTGSTSGSCPSGNVGCSPPTTIESAGVTAATSISSSGTGTGTTGTYNVSNSQLISSATFYQYSGVHGDGVGVFPSGSFTLPAYVTSYSTFLGVGSEDTNTSLNTIYEGTYVSGQSITLWQSDHSTYVTNSNTYGGDATFGYNVGHNNVTSIGTVTLQNNWIDATGSYGCILFRSGFEYNNSPTFNVAVSSGATATTANTNFNLLGNGSHQFDPNINNIATAGCYGHH